MKRLLSWLRDHLAWSWVPASEREASEAVVRNFWLHWFPAKMAEESLSWSYSLWLGTAAASLLLITTVTGAILMVFYVPSVERAYWSMKDLEFAVSFGWLLRAQHRWAAHLMVVAVFLHMARVFFTGAYHGPRALNWLIGISLLLLTLLFSFTGYLLPWDQLAFWAITVGTTIAAAAPLLGPPLRFVLIGGTEIGQQALIRFYVLHVFTLPAVVLGLLAYHLWRVRKDGGLACAERLRDERASCEGDPEPAKTYALWGVTRGTLVAVSTLAPGEQHALLSVPHVVRRGLLVFLLTFNLTVLLSLLGRAPLEEAANPMLTPNPAKAPWYFLWLQELVADTTLRIGGFTLSGALVGGILIPAALLLLACLWPLLDRSPAECEGVWWPRARRWQVLVFALVTLAIVALIYVGQALRGPYWHIYWPWEVRPGLPTRF